MNINRELYASVRQKVGGVNVLLCECDMWVL